MAYCKVEIVAMVERDNTDNSVASSPGKTKSARRNPAQNSKQQAYAATAKGASKLSKATQAKAIPFIARPANVQEAAAAAAAANLTNKLTLSDH